MHSGIDLAAPMHTPIRAPADGVVVEAGWRDGYGNYLRVRHDAIYQTVYGHLDRFAPGVREGTPVVRGAIIGFVGETGRATGPHLHFELWAKGAPVDPRVMLLGPSPAVWTGEQLREAILLARTESIIDAILSKSASDGP
jgi:murein DD-endopeptidase MepM/ murein hydrolase activator NlpD